MAWIQNGWPPTCNPGCGYPCEINQVQLNVTDAILHFIGDGSALSNLNASNVAFGTLSTSIFPVSGITAGTYGDSSNVSQVTIDQYGRVTEAANVGIVSSQWIGMPGSSIYYVPGVSIGSSADATANLQVTGNVYVSNTVTVPNVHVTDTLAVTGALTANASNATFLFDTFTIPYINTQYLNVSSTTTLTGNLVAETANIATLNVGYLTVNSAVVYGATTLNVYGVSNLTNVYMTSANVGTLNVWQVSNLSTLVMTGMTDQTTLNVSGNVYVSNALTTRNVFATTYYGDGGILSNVLSSQWTGTKGSPIYYVPGVSIGSSTTATSNLQVTGNLYVSNAVTTTNITCAGFTSNVSNTIFNFDTLTIPFINSSTLNVTSTSNLQIVSLMGTTGQTTLNVSGNIYASNALTTTNVFSNTLSTTNPIPFRNRLINGGMTLWQRNTASTSTTASLYTTADRWCGALGTSGLTLSQALGPTQAPQFSNSLQVATSTLTSGTPLIEQRIENQNISDLLNGTQVTVSFWAGQPSGTLIPLTVGLYYATAVNNFGTQTLAVAATQNTPTLTTANVFYSLSFTLTTALGATNGLSLRFATGGATVAGSTILLSGVQLEKGTVATPFDIRPYATELALAQRYYYQLTSPTAAVQGSSAVYAIFGTATGITTTAFWLPIQFPVTMRTPNYTFSNSAVSNFQLLPTGTTTITSVGIQSDSYTSVGATLNFVGTNITTGGSYIFRTNGLTGSNVAFFGFACEL